MQSCNCLHSLAGRASQLNLLFCPRQKNTSTNRFTDSCGVLDFQKPYFRTGFEFIGIVQPGTTVTITLEVKRNPSTSGTYLFGVTAYPVGEKGIGSFLGHGRLFFYDNAR